MIELPKIDKEGKYYVSYSQVQLWNEKKGFDTGLPGKQEYIRKYFLNEKFEDKTGYGQFGSEVEAYICKREFADKFSDNERKVLDQIKPLGRFQTEFKIDFGDFYLWGFIDDANKAITHIRDYKTASHASGKKYESDEYTQMDIYALAAKSITGKLPKKLEVCCIERKGNGFKGGRTVLEVANDVWYIERKVDEQRLKQIEENIISTVNEISEYWKIFKTLNK